MDPKKFSKFVRYLDLCKRPALRRFLLNTLARQFVECLAADGNATLDVLLAQLGVSVHPSFSALILAMIELTPEDALKSSAFLNSYFDKPAAVPIKDRVSLCRTNLNKCFHSRVVCTDAATLQICVARIYAGNPT